MGVNIHSLLTYFFLDGITQKKKKRPESKHSESRHHGECLDLVKKNFFFVEITQVYSLSKTAEIFGDQLNFNQFSFNSQK